MRCAERRCASGTAREDLPRSAPGLLQASSGERPEAPPRTAPPASAAHFDPTPLGQSELRHSAGTGPGGVRTPVGCASRTAPYLQVWGQRGRRGPSAANYPGGDGHSSGCVDATPGRFTPNSRGEPYLCTRYRTGPTTTASPAPSLPHSLTPSLPHSLTPSLPHSLTPSTPPLPPSLTPSSLPLTLPPSLPPSLTPPHPPSLSVCLRGPVAQVDTSMGRNWHSARTTCASIRSTISAAMGARRQFIPADGTEMHLRRRD